MMAASRMSFREVIVSMIMVRSSAENEGKIEVADFIRHDSDAVDETSDNVSLHQLTSSMSSKGAVNHING